MRADCAVILAVVCLQPLLADTAKDVNHRGLIAFHQGKYAEAEALYRQAVAMHRQSDARDVNGYAAALTNLASTRQMGGHLEEARSILTEVLSLTHRLDPHNGITTDAMNQLALLHQTSGQHLKAVALLKQALERTSKGEARAGTLHNLGASYFEMGQLKKAREAFEAALAMNTAEERLAQIPSSLSFLGMIAVRTGEVERAHELFQRAVDLRRKVHGPEHPSVGLTMSDLATFYRETGRPREAAAAYEEALKTLRASVGEKHLTFALVVCHYAELQRQQGYHAEALELYRQGIDILATTYGANHMRLASIYKNASASATKVGLRSEAKVYAARAKTLEEGRIDYGRHTVDVSAFAPRSR
ncbi:MAG TPA: tetratricopeptide repeat protein [Bryobacteraceae bacterium]|nr:tetratricopeptide repeat protein [Bryobacteraceae bacterium]